MVDFLDRLLNTDERAKEVIVYFLPEWIVPVFPEVFDFECRSAIYQIQVHAIPLRSSLSNTL